MNHAAIQASFRLLTSTPRERIRVHRQPEMSLNRVRSENPVPREKSREATLRLHHRIMAMKRNGATHREVMAALDISFTTVSQHFNRKLKALGGSGR